MLLLTTFGVCAWLPTVANHGTRRSRDARMSIVVDLPSCRYTTPVERRGWRGVASRGEDPEKWYDSQGVRSGPPRNYFVQSRDERYHDSALDFVATLVGDTGLSAALLEIETLEERMGVTRPLLNKKMFGTWAPLLLSGELVASLVPADAPKDISCTRTASERLQSPATLTIKRAGERVTKTNGYGTTDAHLQPGEETRLTLTAGGADGATVVSESVIGAIADNEQRHAVPWQTTTKASGEEGAEEPALPGALQLGCVSLLNDYLLVQRDTQGALADVYLRCDNEPVVLVQADLYSDETRTGIAAYRRRQSESESESE